MPGEGVKEVPLREATLDQTICITKDLPPNLEGDFLSLIRDYEDVLAWRPSELQGVSWELIEHHLQIDPKKKPRKQKVQKMLVERKVATQEEVRKLLEAKVIWEVIHTE